MIGYHITNKIVSSEDDVCRGNYLAWLLSDHTRVDGAFLDLDYSVAALLKLIGITKEDGEQLLTSHKLSVFDAQKRSFRLTYYSGKYFAIDFGYMKNHVYRCFYHMRQYGNFQHSNNNSIDYAIAQAREAKQAGEDVLSAYRQIGITSNNLISPIKAFIRAGLFPSMPTVDDIPEEAGLYAYNCLRGNWVESYKLGCFNPAYDFDINGAYGYFLSQLWDIRRGNWVNSIDEPSDAIYGFAKGLLTITAPFHPFLVGGGDMQYTPTGTQERTITKQEWNFVRMYKLGTFECQDAWWWIPSKGTQYQPFLGVVKHLWQLKQDAGPLANKILKRVQSGLWGMLGQTMGSGDNLRFGDYFNPIYHALVESNCRLAVAKAVLDNGLYPDHLLNISVDGIMSTKPIPTGASGELGAWRLNHRGKAIVLSSGIVGMEGKGRNEEFSITHDKLISLIKAHPRAQSYRMIKLSPVTLAKALNEDRWDDLGRLEMLTRTITAQEERKRFYPEMPKCGQDLFSHTYHSQPWDISIVRKPDVELEEV